MILRGDVVQLGFEGNPPEVSMYRSVLEVHGIHRRRGDAWGFGTPKPALRSVWKEIDRFLRDTETGRRPLTELYARLRRPPFGLKDGPLPVIVVAALLARGDVVAVYERGSFVPAWTPSHAERLLRAPDGFELRLSRVDGSRREVIQRIAALLRLSDNGSASLLGVVRGLVRFVTGLAPYARRTLRISQRARDIRDALLRAREPAKLVFEDLPVACGCRAIGVERTTKQKDVEAFAGVLEASLREIGDAYPALLARAREALARHLSLPGDPVELAAELMLRAREVGDAAVDPMLRSFVVRASDEALEPDDLLASLATHLASKPPREWTDADEDQFLVGLAHVARAFRSAESLTIGAGAATGGQALLRLAVARRGRAEQERVVPLRNADEPRLRALRDRILDTVGRTGSTAGLDREQALAALALAAEALIDESDPAEPDEGDL